MRVRQTDKVCVCVCEGERKKGYVSVCECVFTCRCGVQRIQCYDYIIC